MNIRAANALAADRYLGKPGIVGAGVGEQGVVVLVEKKLPLDALKSQDVISKEIHGVPTSVAQVGHIKALQARTDKWRPAPGGVSIGHYKITAGTLGAKVIDKNSRIPLILSNNHVLANCNKVKPGDRILQPGPADGGTDKDQIGMLYRFVEIDFGEDEPGDCPIAKAYLGIGNWLAGLFKSKQVIYTKNVDPQAVNYVDAALAIPDKPSDILDEILEIGQVTGTIEPYLGMKVRKSGRTTGLLESVIKYLHATITVDYGGGRKAVFQDQVVTGYMSAGGDSGSLGVDGSNNDCDHCIEAFGLLFAGSRQATIYNPIDKVIDALSIEI